jgi:hypothetical protein
MPMEASRTLRHPACEAALTLSYLQDPFNYHAMHQFTTELWLPFFSVTNAGEIKQDAFLYEPRRDGPTWEQMTWNCTEGSRGRAYVDLSDLGIIERPDGTWADTYCVANAEAFRYVELLLRRH